jgi:hypothetical protein
VGAQAYYERHVRELKKTYEGHIQQLSQELSTYIKIWCANRQFQEYPLDYEYQYDRFRVVELTELICRHLYNMPDSVDQNRIYNCVKNCYHAFDEVWDDNPEYYLLNVRMLLNVCLASSWFTNPQREDIKQWCRHHQFQNSYLYNCW